MIRTTTIFMIGAIMLGLSTTAVLAQGDAEPRAIFGDPQAAQRIDDYFDLMHQGYAELEIFQDLGNANLLSKNYESAAFWFERLLENTTDEDLRNRFYDRYVYASKKKKGLLQNDQKDWSQVVMEDYRGQSVSQIMAKTATGIAARENVLSSTDPAANHMDAPAPKIAVSADGKVAYFSKASLQKPNTGIFSKKEVVYTLYRAENIEGEWKNITPLAVCPKHYSAKHPTLSHDGSQLFFASNMPGTYGKFDIYVADVKKDGSLGIAKNMGSKVNTRKDEMFPSWVNGSNLVFASNGRKGQGGLDLYVVSVSGNRLGTSKNLGDRINSKYDDFALTFSPSKGMGFVLSNRGDQKTVSQYAFAPKEKLNVVEKDDQKLWNALNSENNTEYSSTLFEDE